MKLSLAASLIVAGALGLAGCANNPTATGAALGAGTGAVIGGVATNSVRGAAVGAAAGGVAGAIIGTVADRPGYCYARDEYGRRYQVRCPAGY